MAWYHRLLPASKADIRRLEKTMADENQTILDEVTEIKTNYSAAVTELAGEITTLNNSVTALQQAIAAGLQPSAAVQAAMADLLTASRSAKTSADAQVAALNPPPAPPTTDAGSTGATTS